MKFQTAIQVLTPIMQFSPEFQSGQVEVNWAAKSGWTRTPG